MCPIVALNYPLGGVLSIVARTACTDDCLCLHCFMWQEHSSSFAFRIEKDGRMHGFLSWFDVRFEGKGCETVVLSTSPMHPYVFAPHHL